MSLRCPNSRILTVVRPLQLAIIALVLATAAPYAAHAQVPPVDAVAIEAVYGFYSGYLDYALAGPTGERTGSYVADRAYRSSPFLTARLIAEVDALLANADPNEGWGDDPFLQARGIPARISLELVTFSRRNATVLVHVYFGVNPVPRSLAVHLIDDRGFWRLDDIRRDDVTPVGVVQRFYDAHLQPGRAAVLMDSCVAGREAEAATPTVWLAFDPFPLGDAVPRRVDVALIAETDSRADVLVMQYFGGNIPPRPLLVTLNAVESCWRIRRIASAVEPEMVAQVFYNRYLAAAHYFHRFNLPAASLLDVVDFPAYMTLWQLEEVRPVLTGPTLPFFDPVLQTDQLPQTVHAELWERVADRATVGITGIYADGPGRTRRVDLALLDMALRDGRWVIENILY